MKKLVLALVVMAIMASLGAAQYHDPVWVVGNFYASTSTFYMPGLFKMDGNTNTYSTILSPLTNPNFKHYYIYGTKMDADNKRVVINVSGTSSTTYNVKNGYFRVDPMAGTWTTIFVGNYGQNGPVYYNYRMIVNQDGDYVFGAYGRQQVTVPTTKTQYDYHILKYDASSTLSTVFTSYQFNNPANRAYFSGALGTQIETGDYLVNTGYYNSSTLNTIGCYSWITIDPAANGKWTTFAGGVGRNYYGYNQYYGRVTQDYATGNIQTAYYGRIYEHQPGYGGPGYTTMWNWGYPGGWYWRYAGLHDLQSAKTKRWLTAGYFRKTAGTVYAYTPGLAYMYGPPTYGAMMMDFDPGFNQAQRYGPTYYAYGLDWWQGRHIQSVMTGANKWQIRFSCPQHAGKAYFAVIGASGMRPGITLPSGRTIYINFDALVFLSLNNILLPFWSGGPGVLDSNGEAQGFLNTAPVAPLNGYTVHIAMIVMDKTAPDGVAYIPDTFVMKLP